MERQPFYSMNADYSHATFGTLKVVGKVESRRGYKYLLTCEKCGCQGQTVTQQQLAATEQGTLRCANAACGRTAENQTTRAHVEVRQKVEIVSSPRQRFQDRQRQEELDALEGGE